MGPIPVGPHYSVMRSSGEQPAAHTRSESFALALSSAMRSKMLTESIGGLRRRTDRTRKRLDCGRPNSGLPNQRNSVPRPAHRLRNGSGMSGDRPWAAATSCGPFLIAMALADALFTAMRRSRYDLYYAAIVAHYSAMWSSGRGTGLRRPRQGRFALDVLGDDQQRLTRRRRLSRGAPIQRPQTAWNLKQRETE